MATYAIGDIQGCWEPLGRLLGAITFDPSIDRVWLAGDLVNRGPNSLDVLRWARGLGDRAITVLGNHDLYLISRALGAVPGRTRDTLAQVLTAPDAPELLTWLRTRPLLHVEQGHAMVHASIHPAWSLKKAQKLAREAQDILRKKKAADWLRPLSPAPLSWNSGLEGRARFQMILAAFTRIRALDHEGRMTDFSGPLDALPSDLYPWWAVPGRKPIKPKILCGHWAALGLHRAPGLIALDTGCVWGRQLTAYRLEDGQITQVPA